MRLYGKFLLILLGSFLCFSTAVMPQGGQATPVRSVTTLPATCNPGDGTTPGQIVILASANVPYKCGPTANTWTPLGSIAPGASQWVSPNGSDSNAGSMQAPKLTIQAAVNALSSGGTVNVANGTYSGAVTNIPSNIDIECASRKAIITIPNGANTNVLTYTPGASNEVVNNCTIDGNASNQTAPGASGTHGIRVDFINGFTLKNSVVQNVYQAWIYFGENWDGSHGPCQNIVLDKDVFDNSGRDGLLTYGPIVNFKLERSLVEHWGTVQPGSDGFNIVAIAGDTLFSAQNFQFDHNLFIVGSATKFSIEYSAIFIDGLQIADNIFLSQNGNPMGVSGTAQNVTIAHNILIGGDNSDRSGLETVDIDGTITGNMITNGPIIISADTNPAQASSHVTVSGNHVTNQSTNPMHGPFGINVAGNSALSTHDVSITGNEIDISSATASGYGIAVGFYGVNGQVNGISVTGNHILCNGGSTESGVSITGTAGSGDILVSGNTMRNCNHGVSIPADSNRTEVTIANNDMHTSVSMGIQNLATGGGPYRIWGNITAAGQTRFAIGASFGSQAAGSTSACETNFGSTTLSTGGTTTDTGQNCLPANSVIDAVVYRITTTITTAANFTIGDSGTANRFCTVQSTLTAGSTGVCLAQTGSSAAVQSSAGPVRVTTDVAPGAGAIRIIVYYHTWSRTEQTSPPVGPPMAEAQMLGLETVLSRPNLIPDGGLALLRETA